MPYRIDLLPAAAEHPVTAGLEAFDLVTEQYWVLTDDYVDVRSPPRRNRSARGTPGTAP